MQPLTTNDKALRRHGTDIVKALELGANAVLIGLMLYGLSAGSPDGVACVADPA
jgi:isopentenyl diphosphate isomerase/L-lactate dehydrogenase-like FMN-dependent dehydrogenase